MGYYYLKIYNARDNHEAEAKGTKGKERTGSPVFEWTSGNELSPGTAAGSAEVALQEHSLFRNMDITQAILNTGWADADDATDGPWSMRYGKAVYAYATGFHATSPATAKSSAVYKDLS